MAKEVEELTKEAMSLPLQQRLALAAFLLESAEAMPDPAAEAAWDAEIADRVRAIDNGSVRGVSFEEVMRDAENQRAP